MPNGKVLIVDDEESIRVFLRVTLTAQGYETIEAVCGNEALVKAAAEKPDIIILDIGLPDIDGIEVTRSLREWTEIPIIILSVRGSEKDKIAALDFGADDYLTKPLLWGNCWPGCGQPCGVRKNQPTDKRSRLAALRLTWHGGRSKRPGTKCN